MQFSNAKAIKISILIEHFVELFLQQLFSQFFFRFFWPGKRGWQKQFKVCWILGSSSSCSLWKKQQLQTRPRMYLMD